MSSRQNGQAGEDQGGLQPRYRRAFGCVTWVYMGMLTFLAANFFLSLPFRWVGGGEIYNYVPPRLAYLGSALLVPGMVFAAALGARTYRSPRRVAGRVGAGVGALIGLSGFFSLAWLAAALGFARRDQAFRTETFADIGGIAFYLFPPLTIAATVLVVYALYSKAADDARRRRLGLIGAGLRPDGFGPRALGPGPRGYRRGYHLRRFGGARRLGRRRGWIRTGRGRRYDPTRCHHPPSRTSPQAPVVQ